MDLFVFTLILHASKRLRKLIYLVKKQVFQARNVTSYILNF
jgi:hypothetical protein